MSTAHLCPAIARQRESGHSDITTLVKESKKEQNVSWQEGSKKHKQFSLSLSLTLSLSLSLSHDQSHILMYAVAQHRSSVLSCHCLCADL